MSIDPAALKSACGAEIRGSDQLCGNEIDVFRRLLGEDAALTVGCTQEAPSFEEVAEEAGFGGELHFANIREMAGWSDQGAEATPKMAALLAAATVPTPPTPLVPLKSEGVILIYGSDEIAVEAGERLKDILDVTVLIREPKGLLPRRRNDFPVAKGRIAGAKGHFGAFELTVDDFALPSPSSRSELVFGPGRRGTSRADLILDLSGGTPLFPAPELRQGYLRADPENAASVANAIFEASQLVGEFDKPRYIRFTESLCAHERSKKKGCTRCLDLCPAGAIAPGGNHVAISAEICMGCGQCASVCPTGAAVYDYPPSSTLMARIRAMLLAYTAIGRQGPILLFHDEDHGASLIDMLARLGPGLPAHIIPVAVNEVTQIGLETIAASFAYGAVGLRFLLREKPKHSPAALQRNLDYADTILSAMGYGQDVCQLVETDDPDQLRATLDLVPHATRAGGASEFLPLGSGRGLLKLALAELRQAAPVKPAVVPMPPLSPVGGIKIAVEGCTLCLSCVSVCPTGALSDNSEKPMLRFAEDLCVQCGLCRATCPEKVITLEPRVNFEAWAAPPAVIKEEEPFHCISCGKPFGVKSTIERIADKLQGRHWMYSGENASRVDVIKMCDDCRVQAIMNEGFDPHAAPPRPAPRTTEDYLREREAAKEDT